MKKSRTKSPRDKETREHKGSEKVSTREDVQEKIHLPGVGETELVPPGTPVGAPQQGTDGKDRPVVIKPDIQEDDERTTQEMPVFGDERDRPRR